VSESQIIFKDSFSVADSRFIGLHIIAGTLAARLDRCPCRYPSLRNWHYFKHQQIVRQLIRVATVGP